MHEKIGPCGVGDSSSIKQVRIEIAKGEKSRRPLIFIT